jgi:hypothetical protein
MTPHDSATGPFGPWHPGLVSPVPDELRRHCTIFLPQNVFTDLGAALELHDLTGLALRELISFRPERLALHELLIRVTADLSVPDGTRIEDLGFNFRRMTRTIHARYVAPHTERINAAFESTKRQLSAFIEQELGSAPQTTTAAAAHRSGFVALFRRPRSQPAAALPAPKRWDARIADWSTQAIAEQDQARASVYRALAQVASALLRRHGGVWGTSELLAAIALNLACNEYGSETIGRQIEPLLSEAAEREGYHRLPAQQSPVIMNTKGPSASGKSTLRPLQKELATRIGVDWGDFALISPDIWRKQLLDYASLGPHYKYAGPFTGDELHVIDQKLDRYVARKAASGRISHLLIDRFRFDSFAADSDVPGSNLLTRFGRVIYLFFMITPPQSLVERAWTRGLDVGRYKAVDDTLAHAVEAYAGVPELFFTWVQHAQKRVHFEFLDNSVGRGERPNTVAFGDNETLNLLDIKCMLDIERYRKVNVYATETAALYTDTALLAPAGNVKFLQQCLEWFRTVNFVEQSTGRVYLQLALGRVTWVDADMLARILKDEDAAAVLGGFAAAAAEANSAPPTAPLFLSPTESARQYPTLGRWGYDSSVVPSNLVKA